jgi:uncharacterized protein YerC
MNKYKIFAIPDYCEFGECEEQLIATFENVCEDFMDDICKAISEIRDVKCRWEIIKPL